MNIRLAILVLAMIGLAVTWALRTTRPTASQVPGNNVFLEDEVDQKGTTEVQKLLRELPLAGDEPPEEPDVSVRVSVDPTPNKRRLLLEFTEAHGYYVETFRVVVWYKSTPDVELEDSPSSVELLIDKYIPPNGTMTYCAPLVPSEISRAGGDIGASENWGVELIRHGRARTKEQAPNPLPERRIASEDCN